MRVDHNTKRRHSQLHKHAYVQHKTQDCSQSQESTRPTSTQLHTCTYLHKCKLGGDGRWRWTMMTMLGIEATSWCHLVGVEDLVEDDFGIIACSWINVQQSLKNRFWKLIFADGLELLVHVPIVDHDLWHDVFPQRRLLEAISFAQHAQPTCPVSLFSLWV